ncbi:MAG: hypothetical protein KKD77_23865 [Gammaproteobacteria bacterium]|uniref:Uncharacterized protein n=1 Tax=viral metagenome TaxID=1070528 RepID=A0A6M3LJD0_9ZZZZ|nr:hypothetical protein [Gammaproteobacteria bacterium]MBU2685556.1 hypothetical protein [Gammaproteobacteria bacterium]
MIGTVWKIDKSLYNEYNTADIIRERIRDGWHKRSDYYTDSVRVSDGKNASFCPKCKVRLIIIEQWVTGAREYEIRCPKCGILYDSDCEEDIG